ncbi:iron-sulfur cluster repair di-iron protein [Alkalihalobacterium chitinilyticum]|uniref:Iron-sulfur cluster repair di-iron protein n=1 Tax=Alkalihalobacterium chitinilyticum TaxID=2980103 RepID=A0ABT5VIV2_9BACI|nr:iron-sulfur cluster repair di-iron protein [Alkalihalobacterium chitinilyticum]MDE5415386.1 iron-sulfur cluster repair di-iron protein [Alkalihalobacterium chitinilyticum]
METVFDFSTKTGEIVTRLPETSTILKQYKIDFCCGGNRPIGEVIEEKNLNGTEILEQLNSAFIKSLEKPSVTWDEMTNKELIHHIITTHHQFLNRILPELSQFTTKVFRVHGNHCPELAQVHKLFHHLKTELEQHTIDEENVVFPLIEAVEEQPTIERMSELQAKIGDLEGEHEGAGDLLKQLREVTNDYTAPDWACMTYQLTYQKLEQLESDLFEHIHLENNILFPRVLKELKEVQ